MRTSTLASRSTVKSLLRAVVMACFAVALLAIPAQAVRPYTYPVFKQPKAPLQDGKSISGYKLPPHRLKVPRSNAITRNGSVPEYKRKQWSYGSLGRR